MAAGDSRPHAPTATVEPDPVIDAYKKHIDRTLIRENLKLSEEERVRKLVRFVRTVRELQRAGRALR